MLIRTYIVVLLFTATAIASTINGSAGMAFNPDQWNNGHIGKIDNNGTPFFDLSSVDGLSCNVGFYISGSSTTGTGCGNQPGGIDQFTGANYVGPGGTTIGSGTDFWATTASPTTADLNFNFAPDSPAFVIQLMVEATTNHTRNEFGLYSADASGNPVATLVLFSGADTPGKSVVFTPGNRNFGFYIKNGSETYYTASRLNSTYGGTAVDTSFQHFTVFRDPTDPNAGLANSSFQKIWIGVEDSQQSIGNMDFNDMIVALGCIGCSTGALSGNAAYVAPEPDGVILAATGIGFLFAAAAMRRGKK